MILICVTSIKDDIHYIRRKILHYLQTGVTIRRKGWRICAR